jgi:hypothetical protein
MAVRVTTKVVSAVLPVVVGASPLLVYMIYYSNSVIDELVDAFSGLGVADSDNELDAGHPDLERPQRPTHSRDRISRQVADTIMDSDAEPSAPTPPQSPSCAPGRSHPATGSSARRAHVDAYASASTQSTQAYSPPLPLHQPVYLLPSPNFVMLRVRANFYLVTKGFRTGVFRTKATVVSVARQCWGALYQKMKFEDAVAAYDEAVRRGEVEVVPCTLWNVV